MNKPNTVPTPFCDDPSNQRWFDADIGPIPMIDLDDARSLEQRAARAEEALLNITACIRLNPGNTQMPLRIAREALGQGE